MDYRSNYFLLNYLYKIFGGGGGGEVRQVLKPVEIKSSKSTSGKMVKIVPPSKIIPFILTKD
jgi:hypothetical protein